MKFSNIVINENANLFREIESTFSKWTLIDIYIISGVLAMREKLDITIKHKKDEVPINLPARTLNDTYGETLEYVWMVCYMTEKRYEIKDTLELIKKSYESNVSSNAEQGLSMMKVDRVQLFHKFALVGVVELHEQLITKQIISSLEFSDTLYNFIERNYKYNKKLDMDLENLI